MSEQQGGPVELEAVEVPCIPTAPHKTILLKDVLGRRFNFPFEKCKTWNGITQLIASSFLHIEPLGIFVLDGQYSLLHNNIVILPQIWESMVKEDWEVEMRMHDIPEREGFGGWIEEAEAEKNRAVVEEGKAEERKETGRKDDDEGGEEGRGWAERGLDTNGPGPWNMMGGD